MNNNPFIKADDLRSFDFSPWGGIEGFLRASKAGNSGNGSALKRLVPDLARAVDMTAVAVSGLPFDILDESGNVFDTSEDWENKLGGMDSPQRLIYLLASSLCGGAAYVIPTRTPRMVFDLQYAAPHTITPQIRMQGLQYFDRATDQGETARYNPKDLLYFWLPDSDIEIGPAENHPLGNASLSAQLIFNMDATMSKYGERGFVPITLLGAKGMPNDSERKKAEGFFDRLLRGGFDTLAKIVNSEALSLIKVGAGLDEMKGSYVEIRRLAKESIADAFGIPTALFMSDNAFASEFDALRKHWYTASRFVGIYQTIEEVFSEQLLKPYGYSMHFTLESMEVFQEDEEQRNNSLGSFVSAVDKNPEIAKLGMAILGYDLTKEQDAHLEKIITDKEANREKIEEQLDNKPVPEGDGETTSPFTDDNPPADVPPKTEPKTLWGFTGDQINDLALWYSKAKTWHTKGKGNAADWENKCLPEEIAAPIRAKLKTALTEEDIREAFDIGQLSAPHEDSIKLLALSIEKAVQVING